MPTPSESYCVIPLTKGQFAKVDPEDFERLSAFKWQANWVKKRGIFYAVRKRKFESCIYMHRVILGLEKGDKRQGDHKFHDTLDNRKFIGNEPNLRIASASLNNRNRLFKPNASGFKGVYPHRKRWAVRIKMSGKLVYVGLFPTIELAHAAFLEADKQRSMEC